MTKPPGCYVLIAEHRPLVSCHPLELGHLAWVGGACHGFGQRRSQLRDHGGEIDSSDERPTMDLESVIVPDDAFDAARECSLTLAELQTIRGSSGGTGQFLGHGVHMSIAQLRLGNRPIEADMLVELLEARSSVRSRPARDAVSDRCVHAATQCRRPGRGRPVRPSEALPDTRPQLGEHLRRSHQDRRQSVPRAQTPAIL